MAQQQEDMSELRRRIAEREEENYVLKKLRPSCVMQSHENGVTIWKMKVGDPSVR